MNKKGFTLVELLAVISVLAIITLIATPIILSVMNDGKKGAAMDSMYMYVKAVETSLNADPKTAGILEGTYTTKENNLYLGTTKVLEVKSKGTKPKDGGTVKMVAGDLEEATLTFNSFVVVYKNKKATIQGEETPKEYKVGDVIYFDPTGAVTECTSGKEWTPARKNTTCYKWNIIKNNSNNIEILLDHNSTAKVAWSSTTLNSNGPKELYDRLKTDTNSWTKVEILTTSDNAVRGNSEGGTYTINYSGMKARLISAQEIADISKNTSWTLEGNSVSLTTVPWLYQNTYNNGDNSNNGYWTDTARPTSSMLSWVVKNTTIIDVNVVGDVGSFGLRPVVRVLKSNL